MNLLIAGGLLAFAIIAILIAVFLGIGDQRTQQQARAHEAAPSQPAVAVSAAPVSPVTASSVPTPEPHAQVNTSFRRTVPLSQEPALPTPLEQPAHVSQPLVSQSPVSQVRVDQHELPFYAMNGQMRELAEELHSLHQQAWELEQRLLGLTEMLDRVERTDRAPARHFSPDQEVTQEQFPAEAL